MQYVLQDYEDTASLAETLERMDLSFSFHLVKPFVGEMDPEPIIDDPTKVIMFGSYSLRHYAKAHGLSPGVFELRPFLYEEPWVSLCLNAKGAMTIDTVTNIAKIDDQAFLDDLFFVRPVEDSKEIAGTVMTGQELKETCLKVTKLKKKELIRGSLQHKTELMYGTPYNISKEWRIWIVDDQIATYSLYKEGRRIVYRNEIDDDALVFAKNAINLNKGYAKAYVMDICRSDDMLYILETNCLNAAGFYAADKYKLIDALEKL